MRILKGCQDKSIMENNNGIKRSLEHFLSFGFKETLLYHTRYTVRSGQLRGDSNLLKK